MHAANVTIATEGGNHL